MHLTLPSGAVYAYAAAALLIRLCLLACSNVRDTGIDVTVTPAKQLCLQGELESIQGLLLLGGALGGGGADLQLTNAVLLLLCALAVVSVAGWRMLQRRSRRWLGRLQFGAAHGEGIVSQHDGFVPWREQRGAGCANGAAPIQQRHARLKALVQARLGGPGRSVELVALGNLPAAATHQLVSTNRKHSGSKALLGAEVEGSSPWLSGALDGIEAVGPAGAGCERQKEVGLQSLLLQAGELEVSWDFLDFVCLSVCACLGAAAPATHMWLHMQAVHDASGHLVELGHGASAMVFLGRLSGVVVAVEVFIEIVCVARRSSCGPVALCCPASCSVVQ